MKKIILTESQIEMIEKQVIKESHSPKFEERIKFDVEYYNLIYEYKNDCLTAGIKYKKTYDYKLTKIGYSLTESEGLQKHYTNDMLEKIINMEKD